MEDDIDFVKKNITIIINTLSNIVLRDDILTLRIDFLLKNINNSEDVEILTRIEDEIKQKIKLTQRNKFSQEEIESIIYSVLGIEREYDKSGLVDLNNNEIQAIKLYQKKILTTHTFGNIKITELGKVTHTDWRGVEDLVGLPYYKIQKVDEKGRIKEYKVFTHINIGEMKNKDNEAYKNAVLEVLLDERNMTKTNCGGYIGSIESVEKGNHSLDAVKANDKYSLVFDKIDATVVAKLRQIINEKKEQAKKNERRRALNKHRKESIIYLNY